MSDTQELLLTLVDSGPPPSADELGQIRGAIADSAFLDVGSLRRHHEKRIAEGQWNGSTTPEEFADDLRSIALNAHTIGLYRRRGGTIAVLVADRAEAIPDEHLGTDPEAHAIVVYAVDRDKVISGYQFSSMDELGTPEDARWFRLTRPQ